MTVQRSLILSLASLPTPPVDADKDKMVSTSWRLHCIFTMNDGCQIEEHR
jgi:hypothetical protein